MRDRGVFQVAGRAEDELTVLVRIPGEPAARLLNKSAVCLAILVRAGGSRSAYSRSEYQPAHQLSSLRRCMNVADAAESWEHGRRRKR